MSLENDNGNNVALSEMSDVQLEDKLAADFALEFDGEESEQDQPKPAKSRKAAESEAEDEAEADAEDEIDGEESETDDETEEEDEEKPTLVKLKGGEEVTLDELESGYLREKDYRQKTQEVAAIRKELSTAKETVVAAEREAKEALDLATQVMQALMPQAPDTALIRDNPQEYMVRKAEYDAQITLLNDLVGRAKQTGKGTATAQQAEYTNFVREERNKLSEKVPEFKSNKAFGQWLDKAAEEAAELWGAEPDTIKGIADHVSILVLKDALAYRKALKATNGQKTKPGQAPVAQPARPQTRILRPGTATQKPSGTDISKKQFQTALQRSDKGDDSALAALIGRIAS